MMRALVGACVVIAVVAPGVGVGGPGTAEAARRGKHHRRRGHVAVPVATIPVAPAAIAARAAAVAPRPVVVAASFGRVRFVTDKRAYLDRGAADGMAPGQSVALGRVGRVVGACTVEAVGDHQASCVGGRPRVGDTFRLGRHLAKRAKAPVPVLPALIDEQTLQARAAMIADASIEKVDFDGKHAFRAHSTAEVSPGFGVWFSEPDGRGGTYAQERIDGAIHGVEIGRTGFRFDGAFSAVRWSTPVGVERFRGDTPTQFYLWEAEASRRVQEGGTTLAVGRLWMFHTPGLSLLDGIQVGRQNRARTVEGGVYGGLIPSAASLAPSFDIWAAGLYGALSQVGDKTSRVRLARQEVRIGVWRGVDTGVVSEAEALAQAWVGPVTTGGGGRLRWAPDVDGGRPVLERAHLDLGVRPSADSRAGLHLRYLGATLLPDAPLRAELPTLGGAFHALADAQMSLSSRVTIAANAGAHREADTGRHQFHGGAEARLPRLFGDAGGLWFGAEAEQGWMQGENLYVQWVGHYQGGIQVLARVSGSGTRFETPTAIWNLHELGGYFNVDGALSSWLRLRAWSLLRLPILEQGAPPVETSLGAVAGLSLAGAI